ncbi:MAG: hypothetical protein IPM56_18045 [Ignavibacteriales bacterium]|nr:MAG: hypothetical protein IPM56_18045 [Ignavibacteriales bacterium]
MNTTPLNTKITIEYLNFLISELIRIKSDWHISDDEITLFNNELIKFKKIAKDADSVNPEIKAMIANLSIIRLRNNFTLKEYLLNFLSRRDRDSDSTQSRLKAVLDDTSERLKMISNQIKYLS